jgi:S-adenosylmethionine:tRNA ribosyltransferase-isomerase
MKTEDFDYELPEGAIAQEPAPVRDEAKLLAHDIGEDRTRHLVVRDLAELLEPGDLLVVNDTEVIPARLFAVRETGGRVEVLLLEPDSVAGTWTAMVRPAKKPKPGEVAMLGEGHAVRFEERLLDAAGDPGAEWRVSLMPKDGSDEAELLEECGRMPLPPYIERKLDADKSADALRYQTVYATKSGAVAAPTAGLHFTPELLESLEQRGVRIAKVTLHVGAGTFKPVSAERLDEHVMHSERYELSEGTVALVNETRAGGGRVVAVGTTSVRVLESCVDAGGILRAGSGETRLFLSPGSRFHVVDVLMTNFHLPKSTLLMLVSAFAGRERTLALYKEAIREGYRFYSYGDAMLLYGRA